LLPSFLVIVIGSSFALSNVPDSNDRGNMCLSIEFPGVTYDGECDGQVIGR